MMVAAVFLAAALGGQPDDTSANHDAFAVQRARNEHVTSRGKTVFYTNKWDLSGLPAYVPEQKVSGVIRMWGLNYLSDGLLGKYWIEDFHRFQPEITFDLHLHTALTAFSGLNTGLADLAPCRKVTFDDLEGFERMFNHDPLEITMVTGSYDVPGWGNALGLVNRENPMDRLTFRQLDGILGSERTGGYQGTTWHTEIARGRDANIRTWSQLGLTGRWADKPIHVYGLNLRYHQQIEIEQRVFKGGDKWNENLREYANYAKPDGTMALAAHELMQDLANDPYGIAYSGIQNLDPRTKVLALAERDGGPYVELNIENVRNRTYPLYSEEFWYLNRKPGQPVDPKLKEFIRYTLSREGQEQVMRDGKFLPLTAEVAEAGLKKLE